MFSTLMAAFPLQLEKEGIVRRSNSDWASPLHMVQKSDGSWRPCGDFRRLNLISETDCYPLPNMADITSSLAGAKVFSKLDLKKGYHQIPVHPSDVKKTAIITPFGLFEFLRMPFGLKNAGMTFQRFIDRILGGLPFILIYLDDILVASPDRQTHSMHLRTVLTLLRQHGLVSVFPFRGGFPGSQSHRRRRHTTPRPDLGGGQFSPADFHQRTPSFPGGR